MTIHNMRQKRAAYNIISNNCQNFAVAMLDSIQIGAHQAFATSFAVYQAATGKGTIKDLFEDHHPEEQKTDVPVDQVNGGANGEGEDGMERVHKVSIISCSDPLIFDPGLGCEGFLTCSKWILLFLEQLAPISSLPDFKY